MNYMEDGVGGELHKGYEGHGAEGMVRYSGGDTEPTTPTGSRLLLSLDLFDTQLFLYSPSRSCTGALGW